MEVYANEYKGGRGDLLFYFPQVLHVFCFRENDEVHGALTAVNWKPPHYPALTLHHLPKCEPLVAERLCSNRALSHAYELKHCINISQL